MKMKNIARMLCLLAAVAALGSCNTHVDLYGDYEDITVVYGLLDKNADTNYVKITKAFLGPGNAHELAQNYDSSNYDYKLNAELREYIGNTLIATYALDTVTLRDKEEGLFYSPNQKVYYTTASLNKDFKYQIFVLKDNGDTVFASTKIVDDVKLKQPSVLIGLTSSSGSIQWYPAQNATFYEVWLVFHWKEVFPTDIFDTIYREMRWKLGVQNQATSEYISLSYTPSNFFSRLESELDLDALNVKRVAGKVDLVFMSAGEELYNYMNVGSGGLSTDVPEYTNISGGTGLFSSRNKTVKTLSLNNLTLNNLYNRDWGFDTH